MRCPTCSKSFLEGASTAVPFCSDRCRQIDLGRWLNEEQRVPAKGLDEEEPEDDSHRHSDDSDDD